MHLDRQKYGEEDEVQASEEYEQDDNKEEPTAKRRSKPKFMF